MNDPWRHLEERYFCQILPVVANLDIPESNRTQIEGHARALAKECTRLFFMDHPERRYSGTKKAARQLEKLSRDLVAVSRRMAELPDEATDAIDAVDAKGMSGASAPDLSYLHEEIRELARFADVARLRLLAGTHRKPKKPGNYVARAVAEKARAVYEDLTGERATVSTRANVDGHPAYGNFLTFVRGLFLAIGIKARPEYFARLATRLKEKSSR